MDQYEFLGKRSISHLKKILKQIHAKKVFLVTGKVSYEKSGAKQKIDMQLLSYDTVYFSDFEPNPQIEDVQKGILLFKKDKFDAIVAVGGGSVIDTAKAINILSAQKDKPIKYITQKKKIKTRGVPLIAVPTTSGSGSEATRFAVVYVKKIKYSLDHPFLLPNYSIVDAQLTYNLPSPIAAASGMDALSQAVESYWSVKSTPLSKKYAKSAIKIILNNVSKAVNTTSRKAKDAMSKAAHLAGKAINISQTTSCHSISYPMTSHFGIPHGQAVVITLGKLLSYNNDVSEKDINDSRGVRYVKKTLSEIIKLLGASTVGDSQKTISKLLREIHLETQLSALGLKKKDLGIILQNGFNPARMRNNPRIVTKEDLRTILQSIY